MSFYYTQPAHVPWPAPPLPVLTPNSCHLVIRQQPKEALVTSDGKEKARKPLDPPPILELKVPSQYDPHHQYLQNPYIFVSVSLLKADKDEPHDQTGEKSLLGSLVSSLHRLKDVTNEDGGFFIFGDISIRVQGQFRLRFSLYEFQYQTSSSQFLSSACQVQCLGTVDSSVFNVLAAKDFKGMEESTYLSRAFSDQGVRLRLRKEPRAMMGKRSYPYGDEPTDTPTRPKANEQLKPLDHSASPRKRPKPDPDERKEHFSDTPFNPMATYAPAYPAVPSYNSSQYDANARLPNLPNATSNPAIPAYYNTMGQQNQSYGNMTATLPIYPRVNAGVGPRGYSYNVAPNATFQDSTNNMLSGTLPQSSTGYTQRQTNVGRTVPGPTPAEYPAYSSIEGYSPEQQRYQ